MIGLVRFLFELYAIILLARVLLSWVQVDPNNQLVKIIYQLTEPLLAPIRRLLPQGGGMDFSPIVAFIGILVAEQIAVMFLSAFVR
jgi:YggT family protein